MNPMTRRFPYAIAGLVLLGLLNACQPESESVGTPDADTNTSSEDNATSGLSGSVRLPELPDYQSMFDETGTIAFADITESSGITFVHTSGNGPEKHFPTANGSGVALLDYDSDGRLDIFFPSTRHLPLDAPSTTGGAQLYRNLDGKTFIDVTEEAGVGFLGFCHGATVGDYDNNGAPDLFLACLGPNVLYMNNGDGTFREAGAGSGLDVPDWCSGAAPLDFDGDGLLDLYVSCYGEWSLKVSERFCGDVARGVRLYCSPQSITPHRDYLFRNLGEGRFQDVTESAGIFREDGRGLGVIAADIDLDGDTDLYVANDMCPNYLFLNNGDGTFSDNSIDSGAALTESGFEQAGMGVDIEDITGDGLPDLFVTNYKGDYNTIYENVDGDFYQDVSARMGVVHGSMPEVGWGCALADFDNDTWPDMIVVNGHVDDNLEEIGRDGPYAQLPKLWRNQGRGRYRMVRDGGPFFAQTHVSRGAAFGDLDDDGDLDIVVSRMDGPPAILENRSQTGHWIRIELIGRDHRTVVGSVGEVDLGDRALIRLAKGGGSYLSSNDPRILIGLGEHEVVPRLTIRWPGGAVTEMVDLDVDQTYCIEEPVESIDTATRSPEMVR